MYWSLENVPWTNLHDLNLDWIVNTMKQTVEQWIAYRIEMNGKFADFTEQINNDFDDFTEQINNDFDDFTEQINNNFDDFTTQINDWQTLINSNFAELQQYVQDYFDNLDLTESTRHVINQMISSGEFIQVLNPSIVSATESWLASHVTPTSPVVDDTLSISGAAADSLTTGNRFKRTPLGMLENITSSTGATICENNLNNVANNTMYGIVPYSGLENAPPVPVLSSTYGGLLVTLAKEAAQNSTTKTQLLLCRSGVIYVRQYWSPNWGAWKTIPDSEALETIVTALIDNKLRFVPQGMTQNINSTTGTEICNDNLDNVRYNTIYGLVPYSTLADCPPVAAYTSTYAGLLVTMAKEASNNSATKTQIFYCRTGTIYMRQFWGSDYEAWKTIPDSTALTTLINNMPIFRVTGQNIIASTVNDICSGDANNIPNNNIYGVSIAYTGIEHFPAYAQGVREQYNGTLITYGKEKARGYGDIQILVSNRQSVFYRNFTGGNWNRWTRMTTIATNRILGVGDSICEGWRNNNMGFVGELMIPYTNLGVSGATLGVVGSAAQIASQMASLTETNYGTVIADGGINDYLQNIPLGTIPTYPKTTTSEINTLDKTTVCGGLEYLFYLMATKLPRAQRYFLITHKTNNYPTTRNTAGYNQQELHDTIVAVCNVYNVEVIDIYKDSLINTRFPYYKAPQAYSSLDDSGRAELTKNYYVDMDGVHPLWYGYEEGYYPIIRRALLSATYKT